MCTHPQIRTNSSQNQNKINLWRTLTEGLGSGLGGGLALLLFFKSSKQAELVYFLKKIIVDVIYVCIIMNELNIYFLINEKIIFKKIFFTDEHLKHINICLIFCCRLLKTENTNKNKAIQLLCRQRDYIALLKIKNKQTETRATLLKKSESPNFFGHCLLSVSYSEFIWAQIQMWFLWKSISNMNMIGGTFWRFASAIQDTCEFAHEKNNFSK